MKGAGTAKIFYLPSINRKEHKEAQSLDTRMTFW
tara:strand:+ start:2935 stop:3036 length:102 start_codon:yes stop_codon:yes gene_type:complete